MGWSNAEVPSPLIESGGSAVGYPYCAMAIGGIWDEEAQASRHGGGDQAMARSRVLQSAKGYDGCSAPGEV